MKKTNKIAELIQKNIAWFLLIVLCIVFSFFSSSFATYRNLLNILNQNAYLLIAAVGVSLLMMSGNLDLSVGYAMSLNGVITAKLLVEANLPVPLVIVISILIGVGLSMINVIASHLLHISHMFVSFATMTIYQGLAYVMSQSKTITNLPDAYKFIGQYKIFGINLTPAMIIAAAFLVIASFVLNRTYFGRYVFALGGNKDAAYLAGIDVKRMELLIGALCGALCGLAAVVLTARVGSANAATSVGTEFTIITGLLLGGVSIRGGEGKINGCVAGVLLVAIIENGMMMLNINTYYQYVAKGVIMLATIGLDTYQVNKKAKEKRTRKIEGKES